MLTPVFEGFRVQGSGFSKSPQSRVIQSTPSI
jgi:hypothetical protein